MKRLTTYTKDIPDISQYVPDMPAMPLPSDWMTLLAVREAQLCSARGIKLMHICPAFLSTPKELRDLLADEELCCRAEKLFSETMSLHDLEDARIHISLCEIDVEEEKKHAISFEEFQQRMKKRLEQPRENMDFSGYTSEDMEEYREFQEFVQKEYEDD